MEQIHADFTDMLHTKRLQTLQSVDESVEKVFLLLYYIIRSVLSTSICHVWRDSIWESVLVRYSTSYHLIRSLGLDSTDSTI